MYRQILTPFMMAASLASTGVPSVAHAQNKGLNMDTCIKTNRVGVSEKAPPILRWLIPSFTHVRPYAPCIESQMFMDRIDLLKLDGNDHNYYVLGDIIDYYDALQKDSPKKKDARKTLALIDQRLKIAGVDIGTIRAAYEENKPRNMGPGFKEPSCWMTTVQYNGRLEDVRECRLAAPSGP